MTAPETLTDVLADARIAIDIANSAGRSLPNDDVACILDRIESALASAEPVAFDPPCKMVATLLTWMLGKWENGTPVTEEQARDILAKIFAHAQPAAKVEAPRKVFPPAAFEEWFADIWAGTDGIPVPPYQGDGWDAYIEKRQLALGAWVAATESAPTPASVPDGYVMAPHFRGFAHLGLGQYRLFHSRAGSDAELSIVPATPDETAGRVVGDLRDDGPDEIPAELMAVRLRFENVAGLDALEQQLRLLRETHFSAPPTNQEGTTP